MSFTLYRSSRWAAVVFIGFALMACGNPKKNQPAEETASDRRESQPIVSPQSPIESPVPTPPKGGYSLSIVGNVLPNGRVKLDIGSNIPGTIAVMAGVSLAGQKPDDTYIGVDREVTVGNGSGQTILDVSQLPTGQYKAVATFYPRWGFKDEQSRRTGITESIETTKPISLTGSGESREAFERRKAGQKWVMLNIVVGTKWEPADWRRRFGQPVEVTIERWNPVNTKAYYFPSIDVTVFVNVLEDKVLVWRLGRVSS